MYQEIQEKLDEALGGIRLVHELNDRKVKDEEQINKINGDVCDALQKMQEFQAKQKAIEEQNVKLEKLICNIGNPVNIDKFADAEKKAKEEFSLYLRDPLTYKLSAGTVKYIGDNIIQNHYVGLTPENRSIVEKQFYLGVDESKDMEVQVDPHGGYWVRPQFLNQTITRIFETSPVRQYANVINTNTDAVELIIDDDEAATGGWVGETAPRTKTDTPEIGKLTIYIHEQYAKPRITQKMLDDAGFDIEAWLQRKLNRKFTRIENSAFVVGDGAAKPRGFLTYPAWTAQGVYERKKIEQLVTAASGVLDGDDIKKLQNLLLEDYQPLAGWFTTRSTFGVITRLKDGEDRYLLEPNSFKVGDTKILLGSEVIFMSDMPEIASNSLAVVYGDLSLAYTVVDRIGIRVLRDPYSTKPYVEYYSTKRVGGDVTSYDAIKILKIKT